MNVTREYDGLFLPLPDEIRERHHDLFGWEMHKRTIMDADGSGHWEQKGWVVITADGIHTYDLDGIMIRDRVIYA